MIVRRKSPMSGKENEMDLPITQEQLDDWTSRRKLIQEAMPHLSADQREFLLTGIMPAEWDELFGGENDA